MSTKEAKKDKKTTKIAIETDVPAPRPRMKFEQYPFADMKIGDSFVVRTASKKAVLNATVHAREEIGGHYVVRNQKDGVRAWRVL
jgi:hypothetical protein